ncbi:MAG TPA: hypothetical protein P5136_01570 [Methanofastidiosum sp.]|nr:hypothetical protein [Methanofastidiosum sp.]
MNNDWSSLGGDKLILYNLNTFSFLIKLLDYEYCPNRRRWSEPDGSWQAYDACHLKKRCLIYQYNVKRRKGTDCSDIKMGVQYALNKRYSTEYFKYLLERL